MPVNRLVALLTPLVFAPAAGFITSWAAQHLPGVPPLDASQITALFVAGATIAFAKAALWLHGWQLHEQRQSSTPATPVAGTVDPVQPQPQPFVAARDPEADFDSSLALAHLSSNGHAGTGLPA